MRLRVLGCYGGSAPGSFTTSFLVNEKVAVDAGAITAALPLSDQARIRAIFFTHAHMDHLVTLPFLLDNIFRHLTSPLTLYGPQHTLDTLKDHLFNGHVWPDFTTFSNHRSPILQMEAILPDQRITIGGLTVTPAAMDHTVPCYGYLLEEAGHGVFLCGDTCSIEGALPLIRGTPGLEAIILEASFPNRMEPIAEASRHLTPTRFAREVKKLPPGVEVLVTHMKPDCLEEIEGEIAALGMKHVALIVQGGTYTWPRED